MDVRWKQRFEYFKKALGSLEAAVALSQQRKLSDLEERGLIKSFEYTHELSWKVMKDYLEYQGETGLSGSRDTFRTAFKAGLITEGERWMETIISRNLTSHTYDESTAEAVAKSISGLFLPLFQDLRRVMEQKQ